MILARQILELKLFCVKTKATRDNTEQTLFFFVFNDVLQSALARKNLAVKKLTDIASTTSASKNVSTIRELCEEPLQKNPCNDRS